MAVVGVGFFLCIDEARLLVAQPILASRRTGGPVRTIQLEDCSQEYYVANQTCAITRRGQATDEIGSIHAGHFEPTLSIELHYLTPRKSMCHQKPYRADKNGLPSQPKRVSITT